MNSKIFDIINEYTSITEDDYTHIKKKLNLTPFNRNQNFIEIGQKNKISGFLKKGLLRSYYYDDNGNEITTAFIEENSFFSELISYQTGGISERTIEALEPSIIYIFTEKDINYIRKSIENWEIFERKYYELILKEKVNFQRKLLNCNKKEAYQLFIDTYKQAAKYAPKQYIASFLGMTPFTLSRIKL
jgi:CRP-like cAMP-binding protein